VSIVQQHLMAKITVVATCRVVDQYSTATCWNSIQSFTDA